MTSAQARFFADFNRENKEVADFPEDSFSLQTATVSASGVRLLTTTSRKDSEPLHSTVAPSFVWAEHDIGFTFGLNQKFSKKVVNGTAVGVRFASFQANAVKTAPFGLKGTSVGGGLVYKQSSPTGDSAKAPSAWVLNGNATFNNELVAADAQVAYEVETGGLKQSDFSVALEHSNFGVGTSVSLFAEAGQPLVLAGLAYRQPTYSAQLSAGVHTDKAKQADLDLFYQYSTPLAVAVNVGGKFNEKNELQKQTFSVSESYKIDDNSEVKAQIAVTKKDEVKSRLNLAFTTPVNSYCKATVSANLNANQVLGKQGGKDHSFGLQLSVE